MVQTGRRTVPALAVLAAGLVLTAVGVGGQGGQPSTTKGDWPLYTADLKGSKYSPLDQINAANIASLINHL